MGLPDLALLAVAVLIALAVGGAPFTVSERFRLLFSEYGALEELPGLTRVALSSHYGIGCALLLLSLVVSSFFVRRRRTMLLVSGGLGLLCLGVYLFGIYSPIFHIISMEP